MDSDEDIPGDVLGALVKERISKKDCADNVSMSVISCSLIFIEHIDEIKVIKKIINRLRY